MDGWSALFCRRLFKLALKSIGSVVDWVHAVIAWRPASARGASRPRGRPPARWDDRLSPFS
eukprot:9473065-Pyramimonas_sp.AAC.1